MAVYVPTDWVDNVTPVNAANMDKLEAGVAAAVPQDGAQPAGTRIFTSRLLAADGNPAVQIRGDGRIDWGAGGALAVDTVLRRTGPATLRTEGNYEAGGYVHLYGSDTRIVFGVAADTNLYRASADVLRSDDKLVLLGGPSHYGATAPQARNTLEAWLSSASLLTIGETTDGSGNPAITMYRTSAGGASGYSARLFKGVYPRGLVFQDAPNADYGSEVYTTLLELDMTGKLLFGPEGAQDTNLYRSTASQLKTDGHLKVGISAEVNAGTANSVFVGYTTAYGYSSGISFGSALDTNLYRAAANTLKTDDDFRVGGSMMSDEWGAIGNNKSWQSIFGDISLWVGGASRPGILFGSGNDTNLYRAAANVLRTDDTFSSLSEIVAQDGNASWRSYIGYVAGGAGLSLGGDVNLYRGAADLLKTDDAFQVVGTVYSMKASSFDTAFLVHANTDTYGKLALKGDGLIQWGAGGAANFDTNLYRSAAGVLRTDGTLDANALTVNGVAVSGGGLPAGGAYGSLLWKNAVNAVVWTDVLQFKLSTNGRLDWGPSGGPTDTSLYRSGAALLQTDGTLLAGTALKSYADVSAKAGYPTQVKLGDVGGLATITFGSPVDTNLYRAGAGVVKTDGALVAVQNIISLAGVASQINLTTSGGNPIVLFGSAADTNLYRSAANTLKTDGYLVVGSDGLKAHRHPYASNRHIEAANSNVDSAAMPLYVAFTNAFASAPAVIASGDVGKAWASDISGTGFNLWHDSGGAHLISWIAEGPD